MIYLLFFMSTWAFPTQSIKIAFLEEALELRSSLMERRIETGSKWTALIDDGSGTKFKTKRIQVNFEKVEGSDPTLEIKVVLTPKVNPLILIQGLSNIATEGKTVKSQLNLLTLRNIQIGPSEWLRVASDYKDAGFSQFKITLEKGSEKQLLWDFSRDHSLAVDDPSMELVWAGDLDSDGKTDYLLALAPKYTAKTYFLFLSSLAKGNELLGRLSAGVLAN